MTKEKAPAETEVNDKRQGSTDIVDNGQQLSNKPPRRDDRRKARERKRSPYRSRLHRVMEVQA